MGFERINVQHVLRTAHTGRVRASPAGRLGGCGCEGFVLEMEDRFCFVPGLLVSGHDLLLAGADRIYAVERCIGASLFLDPLGSCDGRHRRHLD